METHQFTVRFLINLKKKETSCLFFNGMESSQYVAHENVHFFG